MHMYFRNDLGVLIGAGGINRANTLSHIRAYINKPTQQKKTLQGSFQYRNWKLCQTGRKHLNVISNPKKKTLE